MMDQSLLWQNGIFFGGIPFKHMKNYPLCMYSNDLVCSDGTLEVVFMVHDGM